MTATPPATATVPGADALRGGAAMALAMLAFIANDTMIKVVGPGLPLGELLIVRGLFVVVIVAGLAWVTGALKHLGSIFSRAVAIRSLADVATTFLFLTALLNMPIANATAIVQAVPFTIVVLGALFLGERVGIRRIAAVVTGFAGVLLVVKPASSDFNAYALYALAAMFTVALRDIITRRIPATVPASLIALSNALAVTVGGAVYAVFEGWRPLSLVETGVLLACAVSLAVAYTFMVLTVRLADVSTTAPFRYTVIVWSLIAGFVVFGDVPDIAALLGIALIAGSGLYTLVRERQIKNRSG
jgi:drug/metabolite transporter (DMT)-like permease